MSSGRSLKMIFFPFMAQGHMLPMIDMAKLFAFRGAEAAILTTPANASLIQPAIAGTQVQLLTVPFPSHPQIPPGCENASYLPSPHLWSTFVLSLYSLRDPFRNILTQFQPDCVVTDIFLPWTVDVATELAGIPRIVFSASSCFSHCCIDSLHRHNLLDEELPLHAEFLLPGLPHDIKMLRPQLRIKRPSTSHPAIEALFKDVRDSYSRSYGEVFNSFYELEPDYAEHYRHVVSKKSWHVGLVSLCNKPAPAINDGTGCVSWLDTKSPRSVVYVCFGSMLDFPAAQYSEIALGLEAAGHPFVFVMRDGNGGTMVPDGFEERTRGKGLIVKGWAPQRLILNHRAVGCFVTHCGWNSILEGVSAGVPLVTWPMVAEQFYNERLIVDVLKVGVGVGIKKYQRSAEDRDEVEAGRVERAVCEVMGGGVDAEERRRRAEELGVSAKRAVEEGGSSFVSIGNLMQELMDLRVQ